MSKQKPDRDPGVSIACKMPGTMTFGRLALNEHSVPPSFASPTTPGHASDQIVYVLDGVFEFKVRGLISVVGKGETLLIPRDSDYDYRNVLGFGARFLMIETPCREDHYFDRRPGTAFRGPDYPPVAFDRDAEPTEIE